MVIDKVTEKQKEMKSLQELMEGIAERNRKGEEIAKELTKQMFKSKPQPIDPPQEVSFVDPTAIVVVEQKPQDLLTKPQERNVTMYANRLREFMNNLFVQLGILLLWMTLGGMQGGFVGFVFTALLALIVFAYVRDYNSILAGNIILLVLWIILFLSAWGFYLLSVLDLVDTYYEEISGVFYGYNVILFFAFAIKSWIDYVPKPNKIKSETIKLNDFFALEKFSFSFRNINFVKLVLAALMCVLQYDLSADEYTIIRFFGMVGFGVIAFDYYKADSNEKKELYYIFWGASAILINPIFKIHLSKETWNSIDQWWCIFLVVSVWINLRRKKLFN